MWIYKRQVEKNPSILPTHLTLLFQFHSHIYICDEIGKELSESEIAQFVENLSSMKMSDIYDIVTNAYSHKKEQEIQEQNSSMKK